MDHSGAHNYAELPGDWKVHRTTLL